MNLGMGKEKEKKMTALVAASAVTCMAMTAICFQHCKFR